MGLNGYSVGHCPSAGREEARTRGYQSRVCGQYRYASMLYNLEAIHELAY